MPDSGSQRSADSSALACYDPIMTRQSRSSRRRFGEYRQRIRQPQKHTAMIGKGVAALPLGRHGPRQLQRGFVTLFVAFLGVLRGHRGKLALAMGVLTVSTLLVLIPPYGSKLAIDYVIDGRDLPDHLHGWLPWQRHPLWLLSLIALVIISINAVAVLMGVWSRWHATRIAMRVRLTMRKKVYAHALRLPLHRVFKLKSGGASSLIREDAGSIGDLVFAMLYNPWGALTQLLGVMIILAFVDWRLLLGSIALLPLVYLTHRTWIGRIRPLWRDIRAARQHIDGQVTETFGGIRVVRTFGRQHSETTTFNANNHFMARQELLGWWWSRMVDVGWQLLIPLALAGVLWYAGWRIISDRELVAQGLLEPAQALTLGDLFMFLWYLGSLLEPLARLASSATMFQTSLAALDRVLDLIQEPRESPPAPGSITLNPREVDGHMQLGKVTFAYPGTKQPVLMDVNLDIPAGHNIALVGPSGSGKTTLCNLIARFYDPDQGTIRIDGINLRDVTVESYRRLLAIVEQDIFLFDGTVADNIGYGRRHASRDMIVNAAELANAHSFIKQLPEGYDTLIGERGVKLSGGQRQRLAIARALLADPRILILDEATSNLDTESEQLIQASLRTLMTGRTSFVIAHRLSTIAHADTIVVLDQGRVIEQGRHDDLMARSGRYRQMVDMQLRPVRQDMDPAAEEEAMEVHG